MAELSPAAHAVMFAYGHEIGGVDCIMGSERRGLAAALRAAADQVIEEIEPVEALINIAIELEGNNG